MHWSQSVKQSLCFHEDYWHLTVQICPWQCCLERWVISHSSHGLLSMFMASSLCRSSFSIHRIPRTPNTHTPNLVDFWWGSLLFSSAEFKKVAFSLRRHSSYLKPTSKANFLNVKAKNSMVLTLVSPSGTAHFPLPRWHNQVKCSQIYVNVGNSVLTTVTSFGY